VTVSGDSQEFVRQADDDGEIRRFWFCARCGATVFYDYGPEPDIIVIPVGAFTNPNFPAPSRTVYEDRAHPWVMIGLPSPANTNGESLPP
jgi:hypothetical protein